MRLRSVLCTAVFVVMSVVMSYAQGENLNWTFGHHTRLSFNTVPPVFYETNMDCWEGGSVSFSDASGNVLFYSNGNKVWNAAGNIMLNGDSLLGNGPTAALPYGYPCSSSQGTAVVQSLSNPRQYFLFVLDAMEDGPPYAQGRLHYSIIDMSLDGGMGGIVPGKKNMFITDRLTEKMTTIRAEGCGAWLLTHKMNNNTYCAFKIDISGVNTVPVESQGVAGGEPGYGMLHASRNGKLLVMTGFGPVVELASFDNATGQVFGASDFNTPGGKIGACFSPDDNLLYLGHFNKLSQYDLSLLPNIADVENSEEIIATSITYGQMRRGPDGKIYIGNINDHNIAVIEQPNVQGPGCNYELNGLMRPAFSQFPPLPPGNAPGQYGSGLGQDVMPAGNMLTGVVRSVIDTIICGGKNILLSVEDGYTRYLWNTGEESASIVTDQPGLYWVRSFLNCTVYTDTFHVAAAGAEDWKLTADTAICPGDSLLIDAWRAGILHYTWQDGSHDSVFTAPGEGTYTATVSIKGCELSDSITITTLVPYANILERDTVVCRGTSLTLHALAFPESTFLWDNNVTGPFLKIDEPGMYHVRAENVCGTFTDAVRVDAETCDCIVFAPNAFSPNQDGRNDRFEVRADCPKLMTFALTIYNRYGQVVYSSQDANNGWDGSFKGRPADAGTYFYFLEYKPADKEPVSRKGSVDLIR